MSARWTWSRIRKGVKRRVLSYVYSLGARVECCYCGWRGIRFLPAGQRQQGNRLCPGCGSLERYRALKLFLERHDAASRRRTILEVAPKSCFRDWCRSRAGTTYVSSDLSSAGAMVLSDLTSMGFCDRSFDRIVCMHVLEHVPDDHAAFDEIRRLLKPNGYALIMVPIRHGATIEDSIDDPMTRAVRFGQEDHVRYYGLDIERRMAARGLEVNVVDLDEVFSDQTQRRYALRGDDRFLFQVFPRSIDSHPA